MSNQKFMTFKDLKKREEEAAAAARAAQEEGAQIIGLNTTPKKSSESGSSKSSPSTSSSTNRVHTLADYREEMEAEDKNDVVIEQIDPSKIAEYMEKYNITNIKAPFFWVIYLLVAISITMFLAILLVKVGQPKDYFVAKNQTDGQPHPPKPSPTSYWMKLLKDVIFGLIVIILVVLGAYGFLYLYRNSYYKVIYAVLGTGIFILTILLEFFTLKQILIYYNIVLDVFTSYLILWNFAILAIISIFWRAPPILNKAFLIIITSLIAYMLTILLERRDVWIILIVLAIYDVFTVLCKWGPLNQLFSAFEKKRQVDPNHKMPSGLLFSLWLFISFELNPKQNEAKFEGIEGLDSEQMGAIVMGEPQLGLGDFIFYGLLIGQAATSDDYNLILGCYVAIIVGFMVTFTFTAIHMKPMPALPISIFLGIIVYLGFYFCGTPFLNQLNVVLINI